MGKPKEPTPSAEDDGTAGSITERLRMFFKTKTSTAHAADFAMGATLGAPPPRCLRAFLNMACEEARSPARGLPAPGLTLHRALAHRPRAPQARAPTAVCGLPSHRA